ncbi:hypothetical protein [Paraburkholderia atlantica]|uniref:hypothetical protein n=1 Tax=Paraburkholderia atlantica TaxID=2654982 RepID=UPI0012FEED02|nr:hypothetical protein [Paraburkholderia atlantica]
MKTFLVVYARGRRRHPWAHRRIHYGKCLCQNGSKCISVDSGPRSFSPSSGQQPAMRRLKRLNERAREFRYAMQMSRADYFKPIEWKLRLPVFESMASRQ